MGVRVAGVVVATSFLLGLLFTHWIADSLTLWQSPLTNEHLRTAAIYYASFASLPVWMVLALVTVALAGAASLLASFREGEAGNVMFDGASIFLYVCTIYVYCSSVLPNLSEVYSRPLPAAEPNTFPFPAELRQPTIELASSHLICSVALTGVLILQAGRYWAEGEDRSQLEQDAEEEARERLSTDGARGRRRHAEEEVEVNVISASPVRKSQSAKRREGKSVTKSGSGSIGRASGSKLRRMS